MYSFSLESASGSLVRDVQHRVDFCVVPVFRAFKRTRPRNSRFQFFSRTNQIVTPEWELMELESA